MNQQELTFGQKAVGLSFNPSGEDNVTKAKQLMEEAIDLLEKDHNEKTDNGARSSTRIRELLKTSAFNAIIAAQMTLVKYLTWKD